jgi:hypothetical protein
MEQIYINAIHIIELNIKTQGKLMSRAVDEYSAWHFKAKIESLQQLKSRIIYKSGLNKNIIFVDFVSKQRVA